ncbi:hypothetical protein GMSM_03790 [Geomonas sp. Red276]
MSRFLVFVIAGWSGFSLMAVELLSGRILAPSFGNSIQVWGAVITVFMVALSVGYLVGGRLSVREPSLAKFALIPLATAAAMTPAALFADPLMDRIFDLILDPRYGALTAAALLFFLPTMVGGMASPYAVRLLVDECSASGRHAGFLFFVSTTGSAAGTILTSFYLVLIMGVGQILWSFIGVSAALGLLTLALSLFGLKRGTVPEES